MHVQYARRHMLFRQNTTARENLLDTINSNTPSSTTWKRLQSIEGRNSTKICFIKTQDNQILKENKELVCKINLTYTKKSTKAAPYPKTFDSIGTILDMQP